MAEIVLNVEVRDRTGTGGAREARRAGKVPGILYGGPKGPVAVSVKANEFRKELVPPDEAKSFEGSQLSFAVDGFFDGSRTKQTALVGVYETCKGKRGTFLLVLALPEGKPPAVRFIREVPGEHEFAMVMIADSSTIAMFHCMECDHISKFKWSKTKKTFVLLPPDNDE